MVQNKGRNVKKSPSQVDTSPEQVDTREPSQKACCSDSQSRSTPNAGRAERTEGGRSGVRMLWAAAKSWGDS
ncbi:hypothetical protein Taro_006627 [Colocasia esculenta]|uniref:Uncharacterized protein n=1 Tax=Colocasia esculenta TaxID=4460 RepID=A0A843TY47_COLES|nr:hypothetical protein [Colocasia esculenta]